jgi:hypothetical protein
VKAEVDGMAIRMTVVGLALLAAAVTPLPVAGAAAAPSAPGASSVCFNSACPQPASVVAGTRSAVLGLRFTGAPSGTTATIAWSIPDSPPGLVDPQTQSSTQPGYVAVDTATTRACSASVPTVSKRTISVTFSFNTNCQQGLVLYFNVTAPTQAATMRFPTTLVSDRSQYKAPPSQPMTVSPATLVIRPAPPDHLVFVQQPSTTTAGQVISPAAAIQTQDRFGNATPAVTTAVDVTLQSSTAAVLHGALREPTVSAVATFGDLMTTTAGQGYRLAASASGLTPATSAPFDILPAASDHLAFTRQPTSTSVGKVVTPAVVVGVLDRFGNVATPATATVDISLQHSPAAGALRGAGAEPAINGAATFADLTVGVAGRGYRLMATSIRLRGATSDAFDIQSGPPPPVADHLAFVQQPRTTAAGQVIGPAVVVEVEDRLGNVVRAAGVTLDLTLASPAGHPPLRGTASLPARSGVASFADLAVTAAGRGYRLHATSGTLGAAMSDPFDITAGAPARLVFISEPRGDITHGAPFADQPRVGLEDAFGNSIGVDPTVLLGIAGGSGVPDARLACAGGNIAPTVQGVASFTGCAIDRDGSGYRLKATSEDVDPALSDAFDVGVVGPPPPRPRSGGWIWVLVGLGLGIGALLIVHRLLEKPPVIRAAAVVRVEPQDGPWELDVTGPTGAVDVYSVRVSVDRPTTVKAQEGPR